MMLPWMRLPEPLPPTIRPVLPVWPEIKLPGGVPGVAVRPPITQLETPLLRFTTAFGLLPRATVPLTSVPMQLPCTVWLDPPNRPTPPPLLAEMILRPATVVPATRLFEPLIKTPRSLCTRANVPVTSVPMRLPCTMFPEPSAMSTPSPILPEIRLRAAGVVPPTVLLDEP